MSLQETTTVGIILPGIAGRNATCVPICSLNLRAVASNGRTYGRCGREGRGHSQVYPTGEERVDKSCTFVSAIPTGRLK